MKRLSPLAYVSLCLGLTLFIGCSARDPAPAAAFNADSVGTENAAKAPAPRHRAADHQVLVMLGPTYASRPAILDGLISEYGLAGSGGMTFRLYYPDSFKDGSKTRLSILSERASDPSVTIVVTVGAPEGTVRELAKIREARPDVRVVTLFPDDDILPSESVSTLLVNLPEAGELLADEGASAASGSIDDAALGMLILASVLAEEKPVATEAPLARLTACLETARTLLRLRKDETRFALAPYVDPDTGLRSRNHLVVARGGAE